ncbi:MAG: response regulator [Kiritimatiellia bacterium]|jgi:CheY-like chemotaxis protein|nr:response regulator [Kiritimatiellia bacterium]MDP6631569.1 response regulator [Kiritimatiellia bacterium]MDP6810675.1 response regulator [Kiritimatiellia bacterium]MDP7023761.1 response regulator [Kiritimatiellia bacterium]
MPVVPCDKRRILVVDDEEVIQKLFSMVLAWELPDADVEVAANGAEALEAFALKHHGVLLMDLHMPVMDGQSAFMTLEQRCHDQDWEMPRVVFCSGFAPPTELRDRVENDSAHCMLSKPVANEVLVDAVRPGLSL